MLLQVVDAKAFKTVSGQSQHWLNIDERPAANPPNASLYNIDNDGVHSGYPAFWVDQSGQTPVTNKEWQWSLDANTVAPTHISADNPRASESNFSTSLIGIGNADGPEKFSTYVMYKPDDSWNGVWVAMNKLVWNWGLTDTFNGMSWVESNRFDQPAPQEVSAAGLYPQWMGRVSEAKKRGWVND